MQTSSLFPPHNGSATSRAAAKSMEGGAKSLRAQVLRFLIAHKDGATDEQIQQGLNLNPSTQRPRRIELVNLGLVHDSGDKRATASGRAAVVWKARASNG